MAGTAPSDASRPEESPPGPHHDPPAEIGTFEPLLRITEEPWFRIYRAGLEPLFFGRTGGNRFDPPRGEFGTLYAGQDPCCAFIETFGHETGDVDFVTLDALRARELARIEPRRPLRLVDLSGRGLARLRADARLCTGSIAVAQRWAGALHDLPDRPDGLCYRSRHDPGRLCAAIFDRASDALTASSAGSLVDPRNEGLLAEILETYAFGLVVP